MKIIHLSDTHGYFPTLIDSASIVIHSGDLCKNETRGKSTEAQYQYYWVKGHLQEFKDQYEGRKLLLIPGNHDFIDFDLLVKMFKSVGIDAYNICNRTLELDGITFYGFPYCPPITGEWNFETAEEDINSRLKDIPQVDVLVTHSPPGNILDGGFGSKAMSLWLSYGENIPKRAWLFGHMHDNFGTKEVMGIKFSNAATVQNVIEI